MARYPHNTHPALVPGVSIEDQRVKYGVDKPITFVVGGFIVAFVLWGVLQPGQVYRISTTVLNWVMVNLGWIFNSLAIVLVFILIAIACSRYGRIPLGLDDEKPQYPTGSWTAMLFGAGIGIGIIFFGPYEPLSHYLSPLPGTYEPASDAAVIGAMAQAALHWGLNAWAIYAVVGLAVAYVSFRRGRAPLMSSILTPILGKHGGGVVDGLAIIATLFGTAASLGLGAQQISSGIQVVTGFRASQLPLGVIAVLTIGSIVSAVSGVDRGIRWLSNINLLLAAGLALFFFIAGPTAFLCNMIPGVVVEYVGHSPDMLAANMGQPEAREFLSSWTTFYWAWWVSWAPFVGVFVAKISRGRTIRQYIFGVLFIPSSIIILAFTILGGTAIYFQRTSHDIAPDNTAGSLPAPEHIFFVVLDHLPGAGIIAPVVIFMLAIFFITSADSASLVNSQLSQRGNPFPNKWITAFWALCMAGIAVVILLAGGTHALEGLRNLITVTALPFSIILVLMVVALLKELRSDPMAIRLKFAQTAIRNAVVHGVKEYGDDFALSIERTESEYATGKAFDSTSHKNTEWYARTDEDGNPVGYDYESGEYLD